jgi:hypothetical protein
MLTENMTKEERLEYWEMVIDEYTKSGLTKTDYCKNNDIPVSTFNYWDNRLKEMAAENSGNRFIELKIPGDSASDIRITESNVVFVPELGIDYQGLRILVNSYTPMSLLTEILGELGYA